MKRIALLIVCIVLVVSIAIGFCFALYGLGISQISNIFGSNVVKPPENGKWKNDELNIVLDFDTGYGTIQMNDARAFCQISGEFNTSIFYLDVVHVYNDDCDIKEGDMVLCGNYRAVEKDKFLIEESNTGEDFWFYRVE